MGDVVVRIKNLTNQPRTQSVPRGLFVPVIYTRTYTHIHTYIHTYVQNTRTPSLKKKESFWSQTDNSGS